ncbi:PhzF family phenazine biosynthesis protein [Cohnella thailandensis]|uniref:PhzF family phenazine biosynthesis protein n=1 Tax=Cohnella thailandensis TaxID=557557 RepID=A0A841SQV1_9BACL|nr:PhzF family phenazine biosynthesis protein [Cohnella thailandensis]MBB6632518.1 PhzF family phenazine biosynthesis protein [Cohnella thailandensis]MBP1971810.1 putative PhzF superfamily epimerase YddE/YHI9 [Cohnella thailandensis]
MPTYLVHRYDAFSAAPERGNPAGVLLEAEGLSAETTQGTAAYADPKTTRVRQA